jgi:hypothetical protein
MDREVLLEKEQSIRLRDQERDRRTLYARQERILMIEILKMTLATEMGREFLRKRFGEGGLKIAAGLLEEMGVQINNHQGHKTAS